MISKAKSSPTSAINILNKGASYFQKSHPDSLKAIHESHYMDDYLDSVQNVDAAPKVIRDISMIYVANDLSTKA